MYSYEIVGLVLLGFLGFVVALSLVSVNRGEGLDQEGLDQESRF